MALDHSKVAGFAYLMHDQARRLRLAEDALELVAGGEVEQALAESFARVQLARSRRVLRETLQWLDREFPEVEVANGEREAAPDHGHANQRGSRPR